MCKKKKVEQDKIFEFLNMNLPSITEQIASNLKNTSLDSDDLTGMAYELFCKGEFDSICLKSKANARGYIANTLRYTASSGAGIHYRYGVSSPYIPEKEKRVFGESLDAYTEEKTDCALSVDFCSISQIFSKEFKDSILKDPLKFPLSVAVFCLEIEAFEFTPFALQKESKEKLRGGRYSKNTAHYIVPYELSKTLIKEQRQNPYIHSPLKSENQEFVKEIFVNTISSRKFLKGGLDTKANVLQKEKLIKKNMIEKLGFTTEKADEYWLWLESFIRRLKKQIRLAKK